MMRPSLVASWVMSGLACVKEGGRLVPLDHGVVRKSGCLAGPRGTQQGNGTFPLLGASALAESILPTSSPRVGLSHRSLPHPGRRVRLSHPSLPHPSRRVRLSYPSLPHPRRRVRLSHRSLPHPSRRVRLGYPSLPHPSRRVRLSHRSGGPIKNGIVWVHGRHFAPAPGIPPSAHNTNHLGPSDAPPPPATSRSAASFMKSCSRNPSVSANLSTKSIPTSATRPHSSR